MISRRFSVLALGLAGLTAAASGCGVAPTSHQATAKPRPAVKTADTAARSHHKSAKFRLSKIGHVWLILLENKSYSSSFGDPKADPYLAKTLTRKGLLLKDYYGTGHESNDNYISLVSGQAPNMSNQSDCQFFTDFPSNTTTPGEPDQQAGAGCVYPTDIATIGNQLTAKHKSWKAYMQDMGNDPARDGSAACSHPASGSADGTQKAEPGDGYATRHNPFVYFHSVIDNQSYCNSHVVALGQPNGTMPTAALSGETGLATDLRKASTTPRYSFITPNLCYDGHDYPCKNQTGGASAGADIDSFLHTWVPKIERSAAYKRDGLIEITFDESDGAQADSSACCGEGTDPNATGGNAGIDGPGGGKIGALLLSRFVRPGRTSSRKYNHYSTLATDEAIFRLSRLGYAQQAKPFSTGFFQVPRRRHHHRHHS